MPIRKDRHLFYLVREMRLELTRRLTHAPQTCLSTYSSTLAYALKGKSNYTQNGISCQEGFFCFLGFAAGVFLTGLRR